MAAPSLKRSPKADTVVVCANCKHPETDHGRTGTRPCLASVGDLTEREFCPCDEFRPHAAKAA